MRQAQAVGITAPGADRVVADKAQAYCPRLEGLVPWFLINRRCLDTFELLNVCFFRLYCEEVFTTEDPARRSRNQNRTGHYHHEGREEHEVRN